MVRLCGVRPHYWGLEVFCFIVLVGAFSVLGQLDTGNPVQIFPDFTKSEARLGN